MKARFKDLAKAGGMTAAEVAVVGVSTLATKKFLDFRMIFKNQIAKNPAFENNFIIRHQGLFKFGLGVAGAIFIKNPWVRMISLGVALEGFISEARVLTTPKGGAAFFDAIGQSAVQAGQMSELDRELLEAARQEMTSTSGQENPANRYPTAVGAMDWPPSVDLYNPGETYVGMSPVMSAPAA